MAATDAKAGHGVTGASFGALLVIPAAVPSADPARRSAGFLAHLFACDARLPAYRDARREEPAIAATAYLGRPAGSRASLDVVV